MLGETYASGVDFCAESDYDYYKIDTYFLSSFSAPSGGPRKSIKFSKIDNNGSEKEFLRNLSSTEVYVGDKHFSSGYFIVNVGFIGAPGAHPVGWVTS